MDNPLVKKLKIKEGQQLLFLYAEVYYSELLNPLPVNCTWTEKASGEFDQVHLFVRTKAELESFFPAAFERLKKDGILWFLFPKKTSKNQSDLNRDTGWELLEQYPITWNALISIDDTWSAFAIKHLTGKQKAPKERGTPRGVDADGTICIDFEHRLIYPPKDFQKALQENDKALERFEKYSFSHRKEYVEAVLDAKKPETRTERIQKIVDQLAQ